MTDDDDMKATDSGNTEAYYSCAALQRGQAGLALQYLKCRQPVMLTPDSRLASIWSPRLGLGSRRCGCPVGATREAHMHQSMAVWWGPGQPREYKLPASRHWRNIEQVDKVAARG